MSLDPDELAELERERDFLLRSLDDLDAEFAAGDLDATDHEALTDDYTRRLAEVARSIEQREAAFAAVDTRLNSRQRVLTVGGIILLAILAGFLLARASGFRAPSDASSGDIRQSSAGLLAEADTLTREGQWEEAIKVYDEVLDISPANAEALTYRGWLTARLGGDVGVALNDLAEAAAVDPTFVDARVFSAIVLNGEQRFDDAADQIAVIDSLEVPDEMLGLIAASNLRASVVAGQIRERYTSGDRIDLDQVSGTFDDVARAGALLSQERELLLSQAAFDAVLDRDPTNVVALVGKGQLALDPDIVAADAAVAADALAKLDQAVELAPEEWVIRLYRAEARAVQGDIDGASDDLTAIDVDELTPDLLALYDSLKASLN